MPISELLAKHGCYEVSNGTLRTFDLVAAFLDALQDIAPAAYQQVVLPGAGFTVYPSEAIDDESHDWWDTEAAADFCQMLQHALEENAPDGYFFGASEGDGASFGFWPSEDD